MNLEKMEGKSMRIFNRVIVAGALVVPMGLGISGIAVADVAAGSPVLPTQIAASEDDDCGEDCDDNGSDDCGSDGGDGGLLGLGIFEGDDPVDGGQCEEDDDDANGSLLG